MKPDLRRIDPEDAEEFDEETETLLRRWAARRLDVADEDVSRVLVEVTGGCGEGTCEFTTARAEVNLTDGRVFLGRDEGFGLFVRDIVEMDVNPDGTERRPGDMWDLFDEDGEKVAPRPTPKPIPAAKVAAPSEPQIGTSVRYEQRRSDDGFLLDQRVEVYTAHGWVNLREVVATYDSAAPGRLVQP